MSDTDAKNQTKQAVAEAEKSVSDTNDEINQLNQYIEERKERLKLKLELRSKNLNTESTRLDESYLKKLDSSIKKVTSFIKRLKGLTESQKDALGKEMLQLNLSKYLSEVAVAFVEAKLKMNDIVCALHLCSIMHQSYSEFSSLLFEQWQKLLNLKKDEKVANPSKLRVDLRFFAELITIGVLPEKEALSLLGNQLTILTNFDKDHANISIITSFCKHCGEDWANLVPLKYEKLSAKHKIKIPSNNIYSPERQKAVKSLLKEYYRTLVQHLLNDHKEIQKVDRQNKKIYQTKGELNVEKKEKYEQSINFYKKLIENTETFSDLIGEPMPELPVDEMNKKDEDLLNIDIYSPERNEDFDSTTSPWEDEETRQFYECIPDLKALIPGILYKDSEKTPPTQPNAAKPNEAGSNQPEDANKQEKETISSEANVDMDVEMAKIEKELQELENQSANEPTIDDDKEIDPSTLVASIINEEEPLANAGLQASSSSANLQPNASSNNLTNLNMKALMDAFINQLPNCVNRELIDKAAKDFCLNLNTKLNRKKLTGALFQVQRTRLDLLHFYSRFVATLNPCMPEISADLSSLLLNDFRYQVRKKDQINIESKIKTARFIGELVKFGMFSKIEALNCLKTLLADFKYHNIDMFCNLLDVCGRFLYRNQESHMKLKLLLEILMRKKQAMSLDSRYTIMIENVFYYCNPPESKQTEKKVRNPMQEYIVKLLYKDLNKLCVEKVLRQMRKINWADEELKQFTIKCLIAAWNVRYNSVHCMANLVSGLALYYEEIGIQVVDGVIEEIRLGLETNLPKFNQRRVSTVKYLGELYNYRMVESAIVFKTLYTLITFAIDFNDAANNEAIDPVDNFFRIRLVCVLLDTCGQYFDRGSTKKKLDCFLLYFQRYYLFKKEAALNDESKNFDPLEVDYVFTESMNNLRPSFKFAKTYKEACEEVTKMEDEIREGLNKTVPHLMKEVLNEGKSSQNEAGLDAINEGEEEDDYEPDEEQPVEDNYDDEPEINTNYNIDDEDELPEKRDRAMDGEDNEDDRARERYDSTTQEPAGDSNSENEENLVIQPIVKHEISKEDEEFMKAFDTLVTENIAQRTKETIKMPTVDISVPMVSKKFRISNSANNESESASTNVIELKSLNLTKPNPPPPDKNATAGVANNKNKGFNFVVMVKKGNKTQYHNMEVPLTSDFANQFRAKEEAERAEKEKLKQLTLNINDRIEQEEFQEMMANAFPIKSYHSNRERHQKYNHPKGTPDADLIFGSGSGNSNR